MTCIRCEKELDALDVGAHRKLVCREAKEFLCRDCLAEDLGWDRQFLDEMIERYRRWGCTLFPPISSGK